MYLISNFSKMINSFYFVLIAILIVVVLRRIYKKPTDTKVLEAEIKEPFNNKQEIIKAETIKSIENRLKKVVEETDVSLKVYLKTENKFLNPSDNFGKMVKGRTFE